MIRIRGLRKTFGDLVAVDGLDLTIERGETLGLLGPNGAGKSTTIRCAIGLLPPDSGTIEIGDLGPPTDPRVRQRIGVAPQEIALYDELSATENLRFFGSLFGLSGPKLKDRVRWSLEFAGLEDRRNDRVAHYSGGMKRRLNLVCALIHEPEVLLLDEPTAGVDPQSRNHLFDNVEELKRQGLTVVYTTHYMEEAERLCDRVAIIDGGQLLALDSVAALIDAHGGRSIVEIELVEPPPANLGLPAPDSANCVHWETDDAAAELTRIREGGVMFRAFHVRRPDLEAVFLGLTGRSLRDR